MFSHALSTATTYFHLPIDEEEDRDIRGYQRKYLTWKSEPSESPKSHRPSSEEVDSTVKNSRVEEERNKTLNVILDNDDLYMVLGVDKSKTIDKLTLRRAYLIRSRACHPDKFPVNKTNATLAFQKIAVAYDVLSTPSSKRLYDRRSPFTKYDVFATRPTGHAEETFRGVVIGIFNDFLDGDLEVMRTLLTAISEYNPSLTLGDDGINSVLTILQTIRERALTCRTCVYALHAELGRLLEVQQEMQQLSYFNIFGRSRLTIQLTRITLSLPFALEKALEEQYTIYGNQSNEKSVTILPKHLNALIRSIDLVLAKMERIL
ncbi:DnaJ-domain-containing protein [Gymnopus androsaceus JB14]|uniref:DnaJ-domain-containing protein n=1 Tax=Gymnopus androsaceus JB14 TaxID=1447944 RepID=A0A6A4I474_9AGAR|nr:DnaJ-domain-containing protein [Gymnopus androsaceus JB14]